MFSSRNVHRLQQTVTTRVRLLGICTLRCLLSPVCSRCQGFRLTPVDGAILAHRMRTHRMQFTSKWVHPPNRPFHWWDIIFNEIFIRVGSELCRVCSPKYPTHSAATRGTRGSHLGQADLISSVYSYLHQWMNGFGLFVVHLTLCLQQCDSSKTRWLPWSVSTKENACSNVRQSTGPEKWL